MVGEAAFMRQRSRKDAEEERSRQNKPLPERFRRRLEIAEKKRAEAAEMARQAALEQQRIDAQMNRDRLLQRFEQANAAQRAGYAADAAANEFGYSTQLADQQQRGQQRRDELANRFEQARARQQAREQELRDRRLFDFSQQENATQFQNQLQRDAVQQGYATARDRMQNDATRERDAMQFGYSTLRDDQQQQNLLQRDEIQQRNQLNRDRMLNSFDEQADSRRQRNQLERDAVLNDFAVQADERQQQFTQQNMYQREAQDISARWQEQVAQARNAGFDFSDRQRKEMQDLETSFRKNVLNGPWEYDEYLKQRAMVEHQKKLSAIVPEEKIQDPKAVLQQSVMFDERNGMWFNQSRDSRGFPTFEPLGSTNQGVDKQAQMEAQQQEKAAAMKRDKMFERDERFQKIIDKLAMKLDPNTEQLVYKNRQDLINAAMGEFKSMEKLYRDEYGLPPLWAFQNEADQVRAKQGEQQNQLNPQGRMQSPAGGMADSLSKRSGDQGQAPVRPPVISSAGALPKQVSDQLMKIPGGDQLQKLREKHKSNSAYDQTMKMAVDVMINSMLTGDTSDPDFAQAQAILERAGIRIGK